MKTFTWNPKDESLVKQVEDRLQGQGGYLEVWSKNVRILCKKCSEGVVHAKHDEKGLSDTEIRIGVASASDKIIESINDSILKNTKEKIQFWNPKAFSNP